MEYIKEKLLSMSFQEFRGVVGGCSMYEPVTLKNVKDIDEGRVCTFNKEAPFEVGYLLEAAAEAVYNYMGLDCGKEIVYNLFTITNENDKSFEAIIKR